MSVQDRIKEYAVLQTTGVRPVGALRLVLVESTILCCFGGLLGTAIALGAPAMGGFAIGAEGVTIAFRPSIELFISGAIVSLVVGVVAGLAPSIQAATVPIVNALNQ